MTHTIINQLGKHISESHIRNEIIATMDAGLDYTYWDGSKITIMKDYRNTEKKIRETEVHIEGIE